MGEASLETSPKNNMIQDMINSDNMNSTESTIPNIFKTINKELFKVEYLIKLSQYFRNLAEAVRRLYNKTFFSKVFKVLAAFNKVFWNLTLFRLEGGGHNVPPLQVFSLLCQNSL